MLLINVLNSFGILNIFRQKRLLLGLGIALFVASSEYVQAHPFHEIKGGILYHDIKSNLDQRYENGADINGEVLFTISKESILHAIWSPLPHLGASINTRGGTSQFYGGLTWHFAIYDPLFLEASFGGVVHNGKTSKASSKRQALGSKGLFRESISLGLKFLEQHSIAVMLDHSSNASLTSQNPGLTGLGIRYGYKFGSYANRVGKQ